MKLKKSSLITFITLASLACLHPAFADAATDVATVNGKPIKQSLVDFIAKDATARGQKVDDNVQKIIINKLIASELVYQEAQRTGFDKQPDFLAREELARRELLVNSFLQDYLKKNPVSDADAKAAYEKLKTQMGDKEYSAKHILVAKEDEAKDIIAKLNKGGDFAKLAKEKSMDSSKEKGGDLGWFSPAGMVKPFADAVVALKKGAITATPVQSQFGWHVIKLEDIRPTQPPAFDKVKDDIKKQLQQQKFEKLVMDLKNKATIVDSSATAKK